MIAADVRDGRALVDELRHRPARVSIVTPRSPDAARGVAADEVWLTTRAAALPAAALDRLKAATAPCVMAPRRPIAGGSLLWRSW